MRIGVLGINYKSSDVAFRELIAKACERIFSGEEQGLYAIGPVLLSTCNRTEIYFSSEDMAEAHTLLLSLLKKQIQVPFEHRLYSFFCRQCFTHLARVTAGLDSYILAEAEIQRQVKRAYEQAAQCSPLPSSIHFLFQKCLKIGKEVRSHFPLMRGVPTLESSIFQVGLSLVKDLKQRKVLFVGNSQTNRRVMSFFLSKNILDVTVCTRSPTEGERMVDRSVLTKWWEFDLVVCATNERNYLLRSEDLCENMPDNRLIFDLSVPRSVDPLLEKHPAIALLNIDQLSELLEKKRRMHFKEVQESETLVRALVDRQLAIFQNKKQMLLAVS